MYPEEQDFWDKTENKQNRNNKTENIQDTFKSSELDSTFTLKGFESTNKSRFQTLDARANKRQVALSQNGYARFLIVACGTGLLFGLGSLFYFALINSGLSEIEVDKLEIETTSFKIPEGTSELRDLKSRLALRSQEAIIQRVDNINNQDLATKSSFQEQFLPENYLELSILLMLSLTVFNLLFLMFLAICFINLASKTNAEIARTNYWKSNPSSSASRIYESY